MKGQVAKSLLRTAGTALTCYLDDALRIGGNIGPSDTQTTFTEEYDGSGFTVGGALPAARRSMAASGTQTAALFAGGNDGPNAAVAEAFGLPFVPLK